MSKKIWTQQEIKDFLMKNPMAVKRALLLIYNLQTETEKQNLNTQEKNQIGFSAVDAKTLSKIAETVLKKSFMTTQQIDYVREKILKYSKQLTKIANHELPNCLTGK